VLATAQLAAKRLDAITAYGPELLIFDEAHQAVAATYQPIVSVVMDDGRGKVVGLSATPGRSAMEEATDLRLLFRAQLITSPELGSSPVEYLRRHGVLSQLAIDLLPLPEHLDGMRVRDLTKRYLSIDELALEPSRFWAVVDAVASRPEESKQLVFGASVAHCVALAGALQERGLVAAVLSYETLPGRRRKILEDFRAGEINVLLNKTLLATGYDCPSITDVVLASPIRSPILWEQILGRVSRGPNVGGTKVGYVWELDDHRAMHADVMSYARYLGEVW
jgi:superfamily II DNA or RNA helicase